MRLARVLAALSLASALSAQPLPFGTPFALTNTRYQPAGGSTLLRSNGDEAFLFWADSRLRMSRVGKGETRVGRQLFDMRVDDRDDFDAVWTGTHFLVVAMETGTYEIFGRIVSAGGEPQGEPFELTHGLWPRIAFNGKYVLLITNERAYVLTADGKPSGFEPQVVERRFFTGPATVVSHGDRFAAILPTGYEQMLAMFDANGQLVSQRRIADPFTNTGLASNGTRMLAVNANVTSLTATLIQPDGSFGSSETLEPASVFRENPGVVWNGTRWVIAYRDSTGDTRIAEVDVSGQFIVSRQTIARAQEPALVAVGSRVVTAWTGNNGSIFSDELPVVSGRGAPASHEAAPQQLLATATSANATLVLWGENGTRAGIRTHDGRWRESVLPASGGWTMAASDGKEFMVVVNGTAIRLDADGQVKPGGTTRITEFSPQDIAWNGTAYAVIGEKNGAPIAARLTPAGTVFPAVSLPYQATAPSIASNGDGFFAVWLIPQTCPPISEFCPPGGIAGIHLDANLHPIDASPTVLEAPPGGVLSADVTWNGRDYVAAWASTKRGIVAARIGKPEQFILSKVLGTAVSVAPVPGGAAVGWSLFNRFSNIPHESSVAVLGFQNETLIHSGPEFVRLSLAALPAGELAVSYAPVQNGEPHYGATRVMMRIASPALPPRPDAPRATLRKNANDVTIEWTQPPQPVNGYRVEYRVDDGAWTEVERWFDPEERQFSMTGNVALRVRAFNDAGASDYAQAKPSGPVRGRAARH